MRRLTFSMAVCFAVLTPQALAAPLPRKVGSCAETLVKEINYRLSSADANGVDIPIPGSGSSITFTNGGYQVSYDTVGAIHRSRADDKVRVCLTFIPDCSHASPGDQRGRIYKTTNLRTGESWELPDSQHSCGGA